LIDPPAVISGHPADGHADDRRHADDDHADEQRYAGAKQDSGEDVAS
jgi:hypothetical protein